MNDPIQRIALPVEMKEPNQAISIYKGEFKLISENKEYILNGDISFEWFPNVGGKFSAKTQGGFFEAVEMFEIEVDYKIVIGDIPLAECNLTRIDTKKGINIEGELKNLTVLGDKSIPVSNIRFTLPNLRDLHGISFVNEDQDHSRIIFENKETKIIIDKIEDFTEMSTLLERKGGYLLLYAGELIRKKGALSLENSADLFHCFSEFISFINGRRSSPIFRKGIVDDREIWSDYSNYHVNQFVNVYSWAPTISVDGLNEAWISFNNLWKTEKDFLTSVVHWYVEANKHSGLLDGAIIMAQAGLELIYNWLLVERKKIIIGNDAESISASNKIRLILSLLNIDNEIPKGLKNLIAYKKASADKKEQKDDAPESFVSIRNAIVHAQAPKRKKLSEMNDLVKYEALQLGLWYIELSILYIIEYKGEYKNRCSGVIYTHGSEKPMPWTKH